MDFGFGFGFGSAAVPASAAVASIPAFFADAAVPLATDFAAIHVTESGGVISAATNQGTGATAWAGAADARPAWSATALNNKPGVTFDGVDDKLTNALRANQVIGANGIGTVAMVVQFSALPGLNAYVDILGYPNGGYMSLLLRNVAGEGRLYFQRAGAPQFAVAVSLATPYLVVWRANTTDAYLSVNGGAETTGAASGDPGGLTNTLVLGGDGGDQGFCNFICSQLWIAPTACETTDIAALYAYLQSAGFLP